MPLLISIIDENGRVQHDQLRDLVDSTSLAQFTDQAKHPFLVGKEFYDGELSKKSLNSTSTSTMKFSAAELYDVIGEKGATTLQFSGRTRQDDSSEKKSTMSNAIFCLRKKSYSDDAERNIFSIGRSRNNDIVVADYVISKHHAQIIFFHDMYFIMDLGSTNGTKVNHRPIPPNMKMKLPINSTIAFGRFCFVFAHPLQVYRGMRKEILGL